MSEDIIFCDATGLAERIRSSEESSSLRLSFATISRAVA